MSCLHGNPIGDCDICDEIDAAFEAGRQSALAEQPAPVQQETSITRSLHDMSKTYTQEEVNAITALVRADEREACAQLCEDEWQTAHEIQDAIRARGNT